MDKKIIAVVTGMQHSGTTYLNKVINSHPRIMSGLECGILLGNLKNFEVIKPFSDWLKDESNFALPDDCLEKIKNMTYEQAYVYIQKNKGKNFKGNIKNYHNILQKAPNFTDKAPRYIYELENIHSKIKDLNIPIFIVLKKYDEIYYSWVLKRKIDINVFINNIELCIKSLKYISINKPDNIYLFEYQNLINNRKLYNNKIMELIKIYNKKIPFENLHEAKYNQKIKYNKKYVKDKESVKIKVNPEEHKLKKLYNHLINILKVKL